MLRHISSLLHSLWLHCKNQTFYRKFKIFQKWVLLRRTRLQSSCGFLSTRDGENVSWIKCMPKVRQLAIHLNGTKQRNSGRWNKQKKKKNMDFKRWTTTKLVPIITLSIKHMCRTHGSNFCSSFPWPVANMRILSNP